MSRKAPGGTGRRRKFRVRMPDEGDPGPGGPERDRRAPAIGPDEDDERAENYLAEEAQRPFVPEVFLIKKRP